MRTAAEGSGAAVRSGRAAEQARTRANGSAAARVGRIDVIGVIGIGRQLARARVVCPRSVSSTSRPVRELGRRRWRGPGAGRAGGREGRGRSWLLAALIATTAVSLGLLAWFAATSVAWFAASPTGDEHFGELNRCLVDLHRGARVGYAVAPGGQAAATFGGTGVAVCREEEGRVDGLWLEVLGPTALAFDFDGLLWLSSAGGPGQPAGLFRKRSGEPPEWVGDVVAMSLAGHRDGVAALDPEGRLYSVSEDGRTLGFAELGGPWPGAVELAADASGRFVSVVAEGRLHLLRASDLSKLEVEAPCSVDYLWWLGAGGELLVECRPQARGDRALSLRYDVERGVWETAPPNADGERREHSLLVAGVGAWVKACDLLPCTARPPLAW